MRLCCPVAFLLLAVAAPLSLNAGTIVIDFEGIPDSTPITTQYPGLTFSNTTVITAGISLNEFEFPPHSGTNVALDDGGPISISFATPVLSVGGYFTYLQPLTLSAFDGTKTQVAVTTSAFSSNDALFGDPGSSPNEFLQVAFSGGISSVIITGNLAGSSLTLDDLTLTSVPEPVTLLLSLSGFALYALRRRHFSSSI